MKHQIPIHEALGLVGSQSERIHYGESPREGRSSFRERTKCEVWTRVMGYHRPVSQFNKGKQSEHYERTHFSEKVSMNSCVTC